MRWIVVGALVPDEGAGGGIDRNRRHMPREREALPAQPEEKRGHGRHQVASGHEPWDREQGRNRQRGTA